MSNSTEPQTSHETDTGEAGLAEAMATVEAILFASDSPLKPAKISQVAELGIREIKKAIEALNARYEEVGAAFRIENIAEGYQMLTQPQYHDVLSRLLSVRNDSRLSQAAMETLAITAYRQPILRADIEAIRGVACGEVLKGLMERQLIKIVGRADVPGRPMLYGTTRRFLEVFGLPGLDDLPRVEELRVGASAAPAAKPAGPTAEESQPAADEPVEQPAGQIETVNADDEADENENGQEG